jgi:hypothetical protein
VIESVFAGLLIVAVLAFGIAGIYVLSRLAGVPGPRLMAETGVSGPVGGAASDRVASGGPGRGGPVSGGAGAGRKGGANTTARTPITTGGQASGGRKLRAPRLPYAPDTGGRA